MRTFDRVDEDLFIVEIIRRLRTRHALGGGRTAPDGTDFSKFLSSLRNNSLVTESILTKSLMLMISRGDILVTGWARLRESGRNGIVYNRTLESRKGIISRLHPDAKISEQQYFTIAGTPIVAKHKEGRLIYPADSVTHWRMNLKKIYVVSDSLPASVMKQLKSDPIQPY